MQRRHFLRTLGAASLAGAGFGAAAQEPWPTRPIRIVTGYAAGGAADVSWRIAAEKLTASLGVQVYVDNRPSAGGIVAGQTVKQSPPDGYTFLHAASGNFAMTPALFKSLPFDPVNDFQMISELTRHSLALVTLANNPLKRLEDVIAAAKASPGKYFVGITAIGTLQHLAGEYFKSVAGIDVQLVPFKGSPDLIVALRAGNIQFSIDTLAPVLAQIRSGTLRAIAITDPQGFPGLPDVPTFAHSGLKGFEVFTAWNGLAAPARTPRPIVDRMSREIGTVAAMPDVRSKLLEFGLVAGSTTPMQSQATLKKDIATWDRLIADAHIEKQ
ncbi:tripartite tricarboxylate transporter substrate binding protein [Pigmentiphaga soli]|uniref:Tripartite tricarboxylate transporter substrate binding protein n=1 Tax=Pigmentiphaga soli TaxID=1007095 RepID=A0ABP8GQ62_9BURK